MAKKQKSKKKIETKTITKKDIDKLLEDNNIVVDEKKEVKPEEKKEKLKRTKRNAALYEKEVKEEQETNEEVEILDTKETLEIQEEILEDVEEVKELEEEIEELDAEVEEENQETLAEEVENQDKKIDEEVETEDEELEEETTEEINKEVEKEPNEEVTDSLETEDKEEVKSLLADDILEHEMDTSFLTKKSDKKHISTITFKDNYNVLITVIFVLMVIFLGFLIFHYTTFNHHKVKVVTKIKEVEKVPDNYLFLGDSITDYYDLDKYYPDMPTVNSGVGGNTTEDILKDMKERAYQYNPSKVFLLIGTNDIQHKSSNEDIIDNIEKIIEGIKENRPKAEIYLESIYPVNYGLLPKLVGIRKNEEIKKINDELKKYCKKDNCTYINMYDLLTDDDGNFSKDYTDDGLHPNDDGYEVITKELKKYLK